MGELIADVQPDVVIVMGDLWDMPSLSGYDRGKRSFQGRTYQQDVDAGLDFNERLWERVRRRKKRQPRKVFLEGNHEERVERAINLQPELDGAIGFSDFDLNRNYDDVIRYVGGTPGVTDLSGVLYAHYFASGVMGRAIGGEHAGYTMVQKIGRSCTGAHSHILDWCVRFGVGTKRMGLVAGCGFDYEADWAGECNKMYWRGVVIKRNVENGCYDPEFVSMDQLKKTYGHLTNRN